MAKIRYFINKGDASTVSIQCQVSYNGEKKSFSTKLKTPRQLWNKQRQTLDGGRLTNSLQLIRDKLTYARDQVEFGIENNLTVDKIKVTSEDFFKEVSLLWDEGNRDVVKEVSIVEIMKMRMTSEKEMGLSTKGTIEATISQIEAYTTLHRKPLLVSNYDFETVLAFAEWLKEDCLLKPNTIHVYLVSIRTCLNMIKKRASRKKKAEWTELEVAICDLPDFASSDIIAEMGKVTKGEVSYPSFEEIEQIYLYRNRLDDNLRKVADIYLILYFTGMRYSEVAERSWNEVSTVINPKGTVSRVLKYDSGKNRRSGVQTPFHPILDEITDSYKQPDSRVVEKKYFRNGKPFFVKVNIPKPLFPEDTYESTYRKLKRVLKQIGEWQKEDGREDTFLDEVKKNEQTTRTNRTNYVPKWAAYTMHTARHGFGAFMLKIGMNMHEVSDMLGHGTISLTEKHYKHLDMESSVAMASERFNEYQIDNKITLKK